MDSSHLSPPRGMARPYSAWSAAGLNSRISRVFGIRFWALALLCRRMTGSVSIMDRSGRLRTPGGDIARQTDEDVQPTARTGGVARFARDVLVNVIANLIAVAVLYLAGVLAGLLPKSPELIATAALIVLMAAFLGVAIVSRFLSGVSRQWSLAIGTVLGGAIFIGGALVNPAEDSLLVRVGMGASGALSFIAGCHMIYATMRLRSK